MSRIPSWLIPGAVIRHCSTGIHFTADRLKRDQTGAIAIANPGGVIRYLSECEPAKLPIKPFLWQHRELIALCTPTPEEPINGINFGDSENPRYYEVRAADDSDLAAYALAALLDGDIYQE